ncbi:Peptidase S8, subtilisin-related [Parasponia andersonii]|uniref:Peptidase S8, subtilisin-related n=1 Tax=Parasponia andersonii TaxID=3476 RepID=A0A2P5C8U9_PARAD|nr:Peptidase S8, subtilisin-related [Parasponia andersonii]
MSRVLVPLMETIFLSAVIIALYCVTQTHCTKVAVLPDNVNMEESNLETYIVYLKKPQILDSAKLRVLHAWYYSFLPLTTARAEKESRMVDMYRNVITNFTARLTVEEVKTTKRKAGVVFVTPENPLLLHTTWSYHFLGLSQSDVGLWKGSNFGSLSHLKGLVPKVLH